MLLKRFSCLVCGATGPLPTRSPFLQCEACNTISDFDWGVAHQLSEWSDYQATHVRWFSERKAKLEALRKQRDVDGWTAEYRDVLDRLVGAFPTVHPVRVVEPAYRAHFVEFMAAHTARLGFDKKLVASQRRIYEASVAVERKRKWVVLESLWRVITMSLEHFDEQDRLSRERPPGPPPDFAVGYMRQAGISMIVQEWQALVTPADRLELVKRLGVAHQYVEQTSDVHCNTCGAGLPPLAAGETRTRCPYCTADLHAQRAGLAAAARGAGDIAYIAGELEIAISKAHGRPLDAIEVLDGTTRRNPKARMITLRARFAHRLDAFYWVIDDAHSDNIATAIGWAKSEAATRGVELRTVPYREHPRCAQVPADLAELERRLVEELPGATRAQLVVSVLEKGFAYEVDVAGTTVRLAADDEGKNSRGLLVVLRGDPCHAAGS